jgi:hypothetical protein
MEGADEIKEMYEILWSRGAFAFLGVTVILSVFQDYPDAKSIFNWSNWFISVSLLLISGFIFVSSLGVILGGVSFEKNLPYYYGSLSVIIVIFLILKILTTIKTN